MDFKELLALVGDNAEAKTFIQGVEEQSNLNVQTINKNETLINGLKQDLSKFKEGNSLVKELLGVEQVNKDSLSEALGKLKNTKGDDAFKAELDNKEKVIQDLNSKLNDTVNQMTTQTREYNTSGIISKYANDESVISTAKDDVAMIMKSMLQYNESNEPVFLNSDGTTKYINNKPAGFDDVFAEIRSSKPHLFNKTTKDGGGTQSNNNNGQTSFKDMTETQRVELFRKDPTLFNQLKQQG